MHKRRSLLGNPSMGGVGVLMAPSTTCMPEMIIVKILREMS